MTYWQLYTQLYTHNMYATMCAVPVCDLLAHLRTHIHTITHTHRLKHAIIIMNVSCWLAGGWLVAGCCDGVWCLSLLFAVHTAMIVSQHVAGVSTFHTHVWNVRYQILQLLYVGHRTGTGTWWEMFWCVLEMETAHHLLLMADDPLYIPTKCAGVMIMCAPSMDKYSEWSIRSLFLDRWTWLECGSDFVAFDAMPMYFGVSVRIVYLPIENTNCVLETTFIFVSKFSIFVIFLQNTQFPYISTEHDRKVHDPLQIVSHAMEITVLETCPVPTITAPLSMILLLHRYAVRIPSLRQRSYLPLKHHAQSQMLMIMMLLWANVGRIVHCTTSR